MNAQVLVVEKVLAEQIQKYFNEGSEESPVELLSLTEEKCVMYTIEDGVKKYLTHFQGVIPVFDTI